MYCSVDLQICERSLTSSTGGPSGPPSTCFVRAEVLPSGCLIRPCEGGGSIVHIVDHIDLDVSVSTYSIMMSLFFHFSVQLLGTKLLHAVQAWSVPEVLRPLYESSKIIAQKMTMAVCNFPCFAFFNFSSLPLSLSWFEFMYRPCDTYVKLRRKQVEKFNTVVVANQLS